MSTYALLYRSLATSPMADLELRALGIRSAERNAREGITGLLLHGEHRHLPGIPGAFVQWIEGPEEAVRILYARIRQDSRHADIETIAEGRSRDLASGAPRLFPGWDLEVESIVDLPATLPGFLAYVRERREEGTGRWSLAA